MEEDDLGLSRLSMREDSASKSNSQESGFITETKAKTFALLQRLLVSLLKTTTTSRWLTISMAMQSCLLYWYVHLEF